MSKKKKEKKKSSKKIEKVREEDEFLDVDKSDAGVFYDPLNRYKIDGIPTFVDEIMVYLIKNADFEGIFVDDKKRKSQVDKAIKKIEEKGKYNWKKGKSKNNVFISALVLKEYLKQQREPLLTYVLFDEFMKITKKKKKKKKIAMLKNLMEEKMAPGLYALSKKLFFFLHEFAGFSETTNMDSEKLAFNFAPILLVPNTVKRSLVDNDKRNEIIHLFIENVEDIFPSGGDDETEGEDNE